ncbi:MAG: hypothetical protein JWN03_6919 [Nocardia sp.]|uniref:hypothetical protein n=1 Tax=Nocardia sp. TaxID=1821 RepID=UPI00262B320E|nr:hypothetical protein [Nocardia sp.]MCU1646644.1 hypothetical protein [Nocardia sp.]
MALIADSQLLHQDAQVPGAPAGTVRLHGRTGSAAERIAPAQRGFKFSLHIPPGSRERLRIDHHRVGDFS